MPTKDPKYNPWWAKILFDEFIAHFISKNDEEIARDVRESMVALAKKDCNGDSFGSLMVRIAEERIKKNREERGARGIEGGRPRNDGEPPHINVIKKKDQLVYGRHENVFLTQEQFNDICIKVGNINEANRLIDSLSSSLEDGKAQSKNHYATLLRWNDYRKMNTGKKNMAEIIQEEKERRVEMIRRFSKI